LNVWPVCGSVHHHFKVVSEIVAGRIQLSEMPFVVIAIERRGRDHKVKNKATGLVIEAGCEGFAEHVPDRPFRTMGFPLACLAARTPAVVLSAAKPRVAFNQRDFSELFGKWKSRKWYQSRGDMAASQIEPTPPRAAALRRLNAAAPIISLLCLCFFHLAHSRSGELL
jgi:hypothetical protein